MRLLEAIIAANHRAAAGDTTAGVNPGEFGIALPIVALTCIDPRLNPLLPEVLGVPEESFIWLRNAGNIITGPMSSTMRSLALACAVKGGKEIVIIGHTDCLVCKTTMMQLTDRFRALGVERASLPANLNEYFGLFASERQNVMKAVDHVRSSPLIGPRVPVHGLLVEITTGKLEWIVNGYQALENATSTSPSPMQTAGPMPGMKLPEFKLGELKFPEGKIGGDVLQTQKWLSQVEVVTAESEQLKLKTTELETKPPPVKRGHEPRPPSLPQLQKGQAPPKLHQPFTKPKE
ncbi:MAG: hypothetical protein EXS31_00605 [Pedosphaera sp.]|nr:hypothetical protein [Pedosphaera sp.]